MVIEFVLCPHVKPEPVFIPIDECVQCQQSEQHERDE